MSLEVQLGFKNEQGSIHFASHNKRVSWSEHIFPFTSLYVVLVVISNIIVSAFVKVQDYFRRHTVVSAALSKETVSTLLASLSDSSAGAIVTA